MRCGGDLGAFVKSAGGSHKLATVHRRILSIHVVL